MIKNHSSKPPTHISHLQIQHHSHNETSFYTEIFTGKLCLLFFSRMKGVFPSIYNIEIVNDLLAQVFLHYIEKCVCIVFKQ